MEHETIMKKFELMGARVKFREPIRRESLIQFPRRRSLGTQRQVNPNIFNVDVGIDKHGEYFDINISKDVSLDVVNIDANDRHLLLNAKIPTNNPFAKPDNIKALCGHDERHWFSSQVRSEVSSVKLAKEALKPPEVISSQKNKGVKSKKWNKRKNDGFIRQGEWFLVANNSLDVNPDLILPKEPLILAGRRAGAKPHIAQFAYRTGGETVYVATAKISENVNREDFRRASSGLTTKERIDFIKKFPEAKKWGWRPMVRNPELFIKGTLRHPDHKTIKLKTWHRVFVNGEIRDKNVVFLD